MSISNKKTYELPQASRYVAQHCHKVECEVAGYRNKYISEKSWLRWLNSCEFK